ncbi:AAA family ATPase [Paraburkholderia nodosa]|uniref:AAA family ATPase n=1 Tax=Paraburkholderia nodosa TaxID=392320 RepID=UPI00048457FA|nr:AAA family ATPase [Paraburkholderia nodosa]
MSEPTAREIEAARARFFKHVQPDDSPLPTKNGNLDPQPAPLRVIHADDLDKDVQGPPQVIEDLICMGEVCDFYGPSHSGKTTVAVHMAVCAALGLPFLGRRTRLGGSVVYIASEAWANVAMHVQGAKLALGVDHVPLAIVREPVDLFDGLADVARVVDAVKTFGARAGTVKMVMVDTLARSCGDGDENSTRDMGIVMRNLTTIAEATNAAVVVVHHTGKDSTRGARGSSVIYSNADAEIVCEHDERLDIRTLTVNKQRNLGTSGMKLAARFQRVELGVDEWGKPQTVSVAVDAEVPEEPEPERGPRLTSSATNALAVFDELLTERGEPLAITSITPPGRKGVRVDDWRQRYFYKFRPEPSDDARQVARNHDAKRKEFSRARDLLVAARLIGTSGEWAWRT